MKKKITKIWGIGLVVVLAASLLLSAVPVSAGTLSFGSETLPSTTNNILVTTAGLDIVDLAVAGDGTTMYAATAGVDNKIYKSTDGGRTWSGLTAPTIAAVNLVAVAPDDPSIVAIFGGVSTNLVAFVSTDSGSSWSSLGTVQDAAAAPATQIWDIAISPPDGSKHYIAAAGTDATGPAWYYFDLGAAAPAWKDAVLDFTTPLVVGSIDVFRTVEFSPNFSSDLVAVAVSEETGALTVAGVARFHMLSFNQKAWDAVAGFGTYPVTLETDLTPAGAYTVPDAHISLDPGYLAGDDSSRIAFVGLSVLDAGATTPEVGGIYRLKDTSVKQIYDSNVGINSVGWDGTNLVAGPTASNQIKLSADALATSPTISTATSMKRPGGATQMLVAWSGSDVVSGATGGANAPAAFAVSEDNGKTFTDVSLIDTVVTTVSDIWVDADGSRIFMVTSDAAVGGTTSLWRKASTWQRVWWIGNNNGYIVRGAPDSDTVYVADVGAMTLYLSQYAGDTKWFTRASRYAIVDMAVESDDVAYITNTSGVSKTTNSGFTWGSLKSASLAGGTAYSVVSLGEDNLVVGSTGGAVSYSTDGNSSWTKISELLNVAGNTQVTASGLSDGDYIYAAGAIATSKVERWEIGTSTSWKDLEVAGTGNLPAGYGVTGIALVDGTLYACSSLIALGGNGVIYRNLSPTNANPATTHWATLTDATVDFVAAPSALRTSTGSTKLWVIDSAPAADRVRSYTDTLATTGPTLSVPADGKPIRVNPVAGGAYIVTFTWERPSTATTYQLQVATDTGFNEVFWAPANVGPTASSIVSITSLAVAFNPGETYYWKVRVVAADPIGFSPWSSTRTFTIEELPEAQPPVVIQQPPAPVIQVPPAPSITLQPPDIILPAPPPAPPDIIIPAAPAPAPPIPAW
ncbi:MAG: fibronectin type III domain-containing protein, partial [Chloroflexi bacterium]|nr:fibronectin type III domain-containing protein [Chloroflexota bacterium]